MFSGFYPAMFLLLVALILRGVSFEFRSKNALPRGAVSGIGRSQLAVSWLPPAGRRFANLAKGVPIDAKMNYTGTFWTLLNPYGLIGGLSNTAGFLLIGAIFLSLKTTGNWSSGAKAPAGFG